MKFKELFPHPRSLILASLLGLLALIILGRFFIYMLILPADAPRTMPQFPLVERGPILDRNGRLFAISTRLDSVTGWGPHVEDPSSVARLLGEILDLDPQEIFQTIMDRKEGFFFVKRKITPGESNQIKKLQEQGELKGIELQLEFGRRYPEKRLASHLLGYVGIDNTGLAGLEYSLNATLSPAQIGSRLIVGNSVYLTLDLPLQFFIHQIAQEAYTKNKADSLMIIVAQAKTGEILSYTSLPDYDPNTFSQFEQNDRWNRPMTLTYEPGSVFKVFSMASFFDQGVLREEDNFYHRGYYERILPNGESIRIVDLAPAGWYNPEQIMMSSSNAGIGYASDNMNSDDFFRYLRSFGFGQSTDFPLIGESSGILSNVKEWSGRTKPTISMGQEIGVSALQIISAATTFANDGIRLKPSLIYKIVSGSGETLMQNQRNEAQKVLQEGTAQKILDMMQRTTEEGGSRRIGIPGVNISAKTGTAQVLDKETGRYSEDVFIASILALFPTENPQYIVYVVIENPKGESSFGGVIAAPVAKDVIQKIIDLRGVPLDGDEIYIHPSRISTPEIINAQGGALMPDLRGMTKRQILPIMGGGDYKFELSGSGWLVRQDPPPGTALENGQTIRLVFQ